MRVAFDKLLDIDDLTPEAQADVYDAIRRFAGTGKGGTVVARASGSPEYDVLNAPGYEVEFRIYRDTDPPTMFVYRIELAADEAEADD